MTSPDTPLLLLVPGERYVLFIVQLDESATVLSMASARFLEGLKAAADLLGFSGLQRDDSDLAELLAWAGDV